MKTSKKEIQDIFKAWIAISIAFAIVLRSSFDNIFLSFILSAITVGVGFLLHELSHKVMAQRYGYMAEFRSFDSMLILAIIFSFFGFVFAAPGAVMIPGNLNKKKNGIVSLAGPLTNLILALLFLAISVIVTSGFLNLIGNYGFRINTWLAVFNMIPLWNFDGKKVFDWNKAVYFVFVVVALIFLFF